MYIPPAFRQPDTEAQRALIAAHPLAQLISCGESGLQADPLPLPCSALVAYQPGEM